MTRLEVFALVGDALLLLVAALMVALSFDDSNSFSGYLLAAITATIAVLNVLALRRENAKGAEVRKLENAIRVAELRKRLAEVEGQPQ